MPSNRIVAHMWCCDDEGDGMCYQPQITRYTPLKGGRLAQFSVWEGTFVNQPSVEENEQICKELMQAGADFGIEMEWKKGWFPYGVKEIVE
jgi:hypothetical protein